MCDYLGVIIGNKLKRQRDRLLYEQYCIDTLEQLVDNCTAWDRLDATNDIPNDLENALNSAWLQKDGRQYLKLFRDLMYLYFDETASNAAALQVECGDNEN